MFAAMRCACNAALHYAPGSVMEFAAMSNVLRVDNNLATRGEGNHGKCLKAGFWRCHCRRELGKSSIGCP
jgi:hypothetical protein